MSLTDDPNHPGIKRGPHDERPTEQHTAYLVLSDEERAKGFVRPVRTAYKHIELRGVVGDDGATAKPCGVVTTMALALSETYARDPKFYGGTFCVGCKMHRPVGRDGEFVWIGRDGQTAERVGLTFQAGDAVHHHPTGEDWILATDEENGEVFACGWPETLAKASDLSVIKLGDAEARSTTLREVLKAGGQRAAVAARQLGRECGDA